MRSSRALVMMRNSVVSLMPATTQRKQFHGAMKICNRVATAVFLLQLHSAPNSMLSVCREMTSEYAPRPSLNHAGACGELPGVAHPAANPTRATTVHDNMTTSRDVMHDNTSYSTFKQKITLSIYARAISELPLEYSS
jgi:hypothetical protein